MTAIQIIGWIVSIAVIAAAWRYGRAPERLGATAVLANYLLTALAVVLEPPGFRWGIASADAALAAALVALSMAYRRHWLILSAGLALLVVIGHVSAWLEPGVSSRAYILYRLAPGLVLLAALAFAPVERWLAGDS